jgi:hypothetical protein
MYNHGMTPGSVGGGVSEAGWADSRVPQATGYEPEAGG